MTENGVEDPSFVIRYCEQHRFMFACTITQVGICIGCGQNCQILSRSPKFTIKFIISMHPFFSQTFCDWMILVTYYDLVVVWLWMRTASAGFRIKNNLTFPPP